MSRDMSRDIKNLFIEHKLLYPNMDNIITWGIFGVWRYSLGWFCTRF